MLNPENFLVKNINNMSILKFTPKSCITVVLWITEC